MFHSYVIQEAVQYLPDTIVSPHLADHDFDEYPSTCVLCWLSIQYDGSRPTRKNAHIHTKSISYKRRRTLRCPSVVSSEYDCYPGCWLSHAEVRPLPKRLKKQVVNFIRSTGTLPSELVPVLPLEVLWYCHPEYEDSNPIDWFAELPDELLMIIFGFAAENNKKVLSRIKRVSRKFRRVGNDRELWKDFIAPFQLCEDFRLKYKVMSPVIRYPRPFLYRYMFEIQNNLEEYLAKENAQKQKVMDDCPFEVGDVVVPIRNRFRQKPLTITSIRASVRGLGEYICKLFFERQGYSFFYSSGDAICFRLAR